MRVSSRPIGPKPMSTSLRRSATWLLLAVAGLSLAVAWMLASPVGASPDEQAHIDYAWGTVTGQTVGGEHLVTLPLDLTATQVRIPNKLLQSPDSACYRFRAGTPTASCSAIPADNRQLVTRASYMSRYPPLFYAVEGVVLYTSTAVDLSGPVVLYGARLVAVVLSLLAVAWGLALLSRRFPGAVVLLATLLALPATAWFLAASVNPNGLEIAAAFLLAAGVLSLRVDDALGVRSVAAVLAVPLGTALLAWTRPLSWVWASLILGMLLVPTHQSDGEPWRRRLPLRRLGLVGGTATVLVLVSAIGWFGYALQIRALQSVGQSDRAAWTGLRAVRGVILLLLQSGQILTEQVGTFGWLDTPLPSLAIISWVSVGAVAAAIWVVGRNTLVPRWSMGVVLGLGYLVALLDEFIGTWGWQGRYLLAVTAAGWVFGIPGLAKGLERLTVLKRAVPWMMVVMMAVNALSVVWFLFRNVYGVKSFGLRLPPAPLPVGAPSWIPPLGQGVVLALVALAFSCGLAAVWTVRSVPPSDER
jgi:Predicted membrane protein (DUF2142)